jgi:hypothetical protein
MYQILGLLGAAGCIVGIAALMQWINKLEEEERERAFAAIRNSLPDDTLVVPPPHILYWQNRISKYYEQNR